MRPIPPLPPQQGPVQYAQYQKPVQHMIPMQPVYNGQPVTYQQPQQVQSMRPMIMTPQVPYSQPSQPSQPSQTMPQYPAQYPPQSVNTSFNPLNSTAQFSNHDAKPRGSKQIESAQPAAPRKNLLKIKTIL